MARRLRIVVLLAVISLSALSEVTDAATWERVSVSNDGRQANYWSYVQNLYWGNSTYVEVMSPDGRFVIYNSEASNLIGTDQNGVMDVFLRDRLARITERISVSENENEANAASGVMDLTPDGRYVLFYSSASNLVPDDTDEHTDLFLRDRVAGTTTRVSMMPGGAQLPSNSTVGNGVISADGRLVAYGFSAFGIGQGIYLYDSTTARTELLVEGAIDPQISRDGRYIAYERYLGNYASHIEVYDRIEGLTEQISDVDSGSLDNAANEAPRFSADGRYVAFSSRYPARDGGGRIIDTRSTKSGD